MTAHFLVSALPFSKKTPLHMNQNPIKVRSNLRCYSNLNLSTLLLGFINTTQGRMVQLNRESNLTMSVSAADSN